MRVETVILLGLIIFLIIFFYLKKSPTKYTNIKIGDLKIRAEIADTPFKWTKGLMFRDVLQEDEGMIFIFDNEGYHGFWMMNMSFPIDIIWINKDMEVVEIAKNVQPCKLSCPTYKPNEKSIYVLEVNANFTEKHGVKIGTRIEMEI